MRTNIIIVFWVGLWFWSCGQKHQSSTDIVPINAVATNNTVNGDKPLSLTAELAPYIYTDSLYTFSSGKGITIQNSLPKGGSIEPGGVQYVDPTGKSYAFAVFWTRIINQTDTPLALQLHFPADSFNIFTPDGSYLKLFLPTDNLTPDKLSSFNYGLTGLKPFLDAHFYQGTSVQRTINPNEAYLFYVAALSYQAAGTPRAAMVLTEEGLSYKMSIAPHGSGFIPCGKMSSQN